MAYVTPRALCLSLVLASALAGAAVAQEQFSADMITFDQAGKPQPSPGKIYVADGKMRIEGMDGRGTVVLADRSAKTTYMLMPKQKIALEAEQRASPLVDALMPLDPKDPCPQWRKLATGAGLGDAGSFSCKRVGPESVNGRDAVKFEASSPKGEQSFAWIDDKLHFMIKTVSAKGGGMELRNIKEGPQPANLFELPADYKKMDPAQMMQQMMQRHGQEKP